MATIDATAIIMYSYSMVASVEEANPCRVSIDIGFQNYRRKPQCDRMCSPIYSIISIYAPLLIPTALLRGT